MHVDPDCALVMSHACSRVVEPWHVRRLVNEAGDVDCNMTVNIGDIVYLINYIFKGGPVPCDGC